MKRTNFRKSKKAGDKSVATLSRIFGAILFLSSNLSFAIVGGTQVQDIREAPFAVFAEQGCGGSLIADKWVLTAAHCKSKFDPKSGGAIFAGVLNPIENRKAGTELFVDRVFVHPAFNYRHMEIPTHDLMLVKLKIPVQFNKNNLAPVVLAGDDFTSLFLQSAGSRVTAFGWGLLENCTETNQLYKVEIPIVESSRVRSLLGFDESIDDSQIAAGFERGLKDVCNGDSGGPLVAEDPFTRRKVLVGVVSFGSDGRCGSPHAYGIYTKVSAMREWIKKVIRENP